MGSTGTNFMKTDFALTQHFDALFERLSEFKKYIFASAIKVTLGKTQIDCVKLQVQLNHASNLAIISQQLCYSKISFKELVPGESHYTDMWAPDLLPQSPQTSRAR